MTKAARTRERKAAGRAASATAPRPLKDWQCVVALILLAVVFFRNHLLGTAYLWEDFLYQNYPFRRFAAVSMAMGQFPLWNPFTFNGMPFFADIQTTVLYLPCTVLALFVHDGVLNAYWLQLITILHFPLAGIGMFYLARNHRLSTYASLFAGAAYMLSGFMIVHAIHQQMVTMVAWYPLILLMFRRAMEERTWLWVFIGGLVLGHSIFAGYPQLTLYIFFFLFIWFAVDLLAGFPGRSLVSRPALVRMAKAAVIVVVAIGVAMIQLLPTNELADLSQRAQITYEKSGEGSLAWSQLLTMVYPKLFGTAGAAGYDYFGPGPYWHYWETCIYPGLVPLLLALLGAGLFRKNRTVAFLIGFSLFGLLFALGRNFPLHRLFFDFIPGFATFRIPARMDILVILCSSLLAGFGFDRIVGAEVHELNRRTVIRVLQGAGLVVILLWLLIVSGAIHAALGIPPDPRVVGFVRMEAHVSCALALAGIIVLWSMVRRNKPPRWSTPALLALFIVDMLAFGGAQNEATLDPMEYFRRAEPLVQYLRQEETGGLFRVNTRNSQGMVMDRNQGMVSRIQTMEGYTPLALKRVYPPVASDTVMYELLNVRFRTVTDEANRSLRLVPVEKTLPRAFMVYRLHVATDEEDLLRFLKSPAFDPGTVAVVEEDPGVALSPSPEDARWKADVTSYANNAIDLAVETDTDGFLVLSEIYYPGWSATVDGAETRIFRTDYNLRGLVLAKGRHTVSLRFSPASFRHGTTVTLATLVVAVTGLGVTTWRRRRSHTPTESAQA